MYIEGNGCSGALFCGKRADILYLYIVTTGLQSFQRSLAWVPLTKKSASLTRWRKPRPQLQLMWRLECGHVSHANKDGFEGLSGRVDFNHYHCLQATKQIEIWRKRVGDTLKWPPMASMRYDNGRILDNSNKLQHSHHLSVMS